MIYWPEDNDSGRIAALPKPFTTYTSAQSALGAAPVPVHAAEYPTTPEVNPPPLVVSVSIIGAAISAVKGFLKLLGSKLTVPPKMELVLPAAKVLASWTSVAILIA